MTTVLSHTPKEISYYTVLARLLCGAVTKLVKPADSDDEPAYYIIAGVSSDHTRTQEADLSSYGVASYAVGVPDRTVVLRYYNPDAGREYIRSLIDVGWTEQRLLTSAGS